MNSTTGLRSLRTILSALLCAVATQAADAAVTVLEHRMTLLNVVTNSGNIEVAENLAGAAALGPGQIVGVYTTAGNPNQARGFNMRNPFVPTSPQIPMPCALLPNCFYAPAIATGTSTWLEPFDVNSSGVYVGQLRGSNTAGLRFASSSSRGGALPTMDNSSLWSASAATSINNNGLIVGWKQPKIPPGQPNAGQPGAEQAFYYTGKTGAVVESINIPGASSRALSVNTPHPNPTDPTKTDPTLVAGFFRPATGGPHGFVVELKDQNGTLKPGTPMDIGRVVIPTIDPFDQAHYVSINANGQVAATRPVASGSETFYQASVLDYPAFAVDGNLQGHSTAILPFGRYEDTFATGISEDGWVVGVLRDRQGADSGFLWAGGGQPIDLSLYANADGWTGTTWALDIVTGPIDATGKRTATIVGVGTFLDAGQTQARQRAFAMQMTLQVPEPQTYLMLGLGLLAIGALRMRGLGRP